MAPAQTQPGTPTIGPGAQYLALGNSGPFGTDPRITDAGKGADVRNFIEYPELLAQAVGQYLTRIYTRLRDLGPSKGTIVSVTGVALDYRVAGSVDRTIA